MKKLFGLALMFLFLISCGEQQTSKNLNEDLQREIASKDSLLNEVFESLNQITANLNQIKERENIITTSVNHGELSKEPTTAIREDISAIDQLLISNRDNLRKLSQNAEQLKKSNARVGNLENLIYELTTQMEAKDMEIAELKKELNERIRQMEILDGIVSELNAQVAGITEDYINLESEIRSQNDFYYTAYYIIGSRRELLDKDIVYKSGFIGRTLKLNENRDLDAFTQVDIRNLSEIIIGQKNVEIVTTHPADAYEIIMDDSGVWRSLIITDEEKFWEVSRVLVVSYK